jgi:hypothetical protein
MSPPATTKSAFRCPKRTAPAPQTSLTRALSALRSSSGSAMETLSALVGHVHRLHSVQPIRRSPQRSISMMGLPQLGQLSDINCPSAFLRCPSARRYNQANPETSAQCLRKYELSLLKARLNVVLLWLRVTSHGRGSSWILGSRGAIFLGRRYAPSYSGLLIEGVQFISYGIQLRVGQYLLLFDS